LNSIRSKHINSKLVNIKSNNGDIAPGYKQDNESDKHKQFVQVTSSD